MPAVGAEVGVRVGAFVVGFAVGVLVGSLVVGKEVASLEGTLVTERRMRKNRMTTLFVMKENNGVFVTAGCDTDLAKYDLWYL